MRKLYKVKMAVEPLDPIFIEASSFEDAARRFAQVNGFSEKDRSTVVESWVIQVWAEDDPPGAGPEEYSVGEVL
ncbi:MAG: hypothetical protein AB1330_01930 [Bacillota bacterium]